MHTSYLIINVLSNIIIMMMLNHSGASIFSDKVVAMWKQAEEDELGHDPAMLKWAREGGEFPHTTTSE